MRYLLLVVITLVLVGCNESENILGRTNTEIGKLVDRVQSAKVGDVIVLVPAENGAMVQLLRVTKAYEDSRTDAHKYNLNVESTGGTISAIGVGYLGNYYTGHGDVLFVPKDKIGVINNMIKTEVLKAAN